LTGQRVVHVRDDPGELLGKCTLSIVDLDSRTVVMVTHDPAAAAYADQVILLADGRIAGTLVDADADEVAEHLAHLGD